MVYRVLFLLILGTLVSCSFKSKEESKASNGLSGIEAIPEGQDSDGDLVTDRKEIELGRNPLIADIPDLKFEFMKNFALESSFGDESYVLNSVMDISSKNYEYRVGKVTIWDIVQKTTAKFARYDGIVEGEYADIDLTRISYPYISPKYLAKENFKGEKSNFQKASVNFTNTLKLRRNKGFQKIVNPVFNFHYFNYETGEFDLIAQREIKKNIYEGVLEKFQIDISELPQKLIEDNFYGKGEFITAEIEDFEIPALKTTYKKLMSAVSSNSIPVTVITPLGTDVFYVSLKDGHNKLGHFLKSIFENNFKVENNQLVQVRDFVNNLPNFKHLSELKNESKKGKWFILFNNQINDDVFQYEFRKNDKIVLNYMTGDQLAGQSYHQEINSQIDVSSQKDVTDFEVGEISGNDELHLNFRPIYINHEYTVQGSYGFNDSGGRASWVFYDQKTRKDKFSMSDTKIQDRFSLVLNGKEYTLTKLIEEEKVQVVFDKESLKISIPTMSSAFDLGTEEVHSVFLRTYPKNQDVELGLWITGIGGWIAGVSGCNSADAVCKGWYNTNGIPLNKVCSYIQPSFGAYCNGALKDEYRRHTKTLQSDLHFDLGYLLINRYN